MEKETSKNRVLAAKLSIAGSIGFLVVLALLHLIKSDVDPSWETSSIYARGDLGWIMQLNFIVLAASYVALFVAVKSQIKNIYGRIGLAILLLCAVGTAIGGIFVSDPMETAQTALSTSGSLHGMGAGLALWLLPIATLLINLSLIRKNAAWANSRKPLLWTISLPFVALIVFMGIAMSAAAANGGNFGPGVNIGWIERIVAIVYVAWQVVLSKQILEKLDA